MPPKTKKAKTIPFNNHVFVSEAAYNRYIQYKKKTFILERGLDVGGPIIDEISRRDQEKLAVKPGPSVVTLVTELYANAAEAGVEDTVFVRGKQVSFSSSSINQFYGLPDDEGVFKEWSQNIDWDDVINHLCESSATWSHSVQSGEVACFPKKFMKKYSRVWLYFVASRIMPVSHSVLFIGVELL